MSDPDDTEDFGLRAFENLRKTVEWSNKAYSDVASKLPALGKQLEAMNEKSLGVAQSAENAAQAVTSYIQTDRRTLLITCGFAAIALVFCAFLLGVMNGNRTGYAEGLADGQRVAQKRDAMAEWAVSSPSGRLAYEMDKIGEIQAFGLCKIEGYKIKTNQEGTWCAPTFGSGIKWPVERP